ncbi:hypothetical protein LJC45_02105 [Alistipes sp. OttesenSCG-928-B03]|nr:hypothetical protein [Alistipes sp. OttesenSCG-928-B03]
MKDARITEVEVYKSMLPFGAISIIADRAGVSRQSVHAYLSGKSRSQRIEDATLNYLAELRKERKQKLKKAGLL